MILSGIHEDLCLTAFLTEPYRVRVLLPVACFEVRHRGFEINHQVLKSGQGFSALSASCRYLCRLSRPGFRKTLDIIDATPVSLFFLGRRVFGFFVYLRDFLQSLNRCICRSIQCFRCFDNSVAQLDDSLDVIGKRADLLQFFQVALCFSVSLFRGFSCFHSFVSMGEETCNLHRSDSDSFYTVGDHVIENFHRLFSLFIIGVIQVLFDFSEIAAVDVFEEKRQRCNAVSELYIGALAFLCQILRCSKLFFFLSNQLNQFFLGE